MHLDIEGITFLQQSSRDIIRLNSVTDVLLDDVRMEGNLTAPTTIDGTLSSCIKFAQVQDFASSRITLVDCDFMNQTYGVYASNDLTQLNIVRGNFSDLYQGVSLGGTYTGALAISDINVSHSKFTRIAREALYGHNAGATVTGFKSSFNFFDDVGNGQIGLATTAVNINFGGDKCFSVGDTFTRAYNATLPPIKLNNTKSFAVLNGDCIQMGRELMQGSGNVTLTDNTVSSTSAGVVGSANAPTQLNYSVMRDLEQRSGSMKISSIGTSVVFEDSFVETADLGVTLTPTISVHNHLDWHKC
jgi:hypothetical protein